MSVTADIILSWRHPRQVMRKHLAAGVREDRALAFLMIACVLNFIAQWPRLSLQANLHPDTPFDARIGGAIMAWLFVAPLALYALAAVFHIVLRIIGGKGSAFATRLALFWALLAVAPIWLLNGLVAGLIGPGMLLYITGAGSLAIFILIWLSSLLEAHSRIPIT